MSQLFTSGGQSIKSFSFNISPSNEHSGLISFRMDWLGLLAVQGTFKSLLQPQFKSINSSALSFLYSPTLTSIHDYWKNHQFSSVQLLGHVRLFVTPWTAACQDSLSITNSWSLLTNVHHFSDAIQPSHPLSPPSLPALNLSQQQGLFQ